MSKVNARSGPSPACQLFGPLLAEGVSDIDFGKDAIMQAIHVDGLAIRYVAVDFQTKDVIMAAIREDPRALEYVPEHLRDEDVLRTVTEEEEKRRREEEEEEEND
jgi:hypothetical protein